MYKGCCLSMLVDNILYHIIFCFISCLASVIGSDQYIIGIQDSALLKRSADNKPYIEYSAGDRRAIVELICSDGPTTLDTTGEGPDTIYTFHLTSKCACWNGCKGELF